MSIDAIARHGAKEGEREEEKSDHFVPKRMEGLDHLRHYMSKELDAVADIIRLGFGHVFIVAKSE